MPGVLPLPVPLSIVPPAYFTTPYWLILLGFIVAFAAAVAIFRSLRNYRRWRNILIYVAAALVVSLLLFQIDNVGRWAMVNINCNGAPQYMPRAVGQLTVGAESWGDREANFNVVVSCVNASFQPEQNFIHVNDTTIKVPFLLQTRGLPRSTDSRSVSFAIDEGKAGFSFDVSWEQQGSGKLVVASCDYFLSYAWNGTQNCYVMNCSATAT
jgi:hypothetical protein